MNKLLQKNLSTYQSYLTKCSLNKESPDEVSRTMCHEENVMYELSVHSFKLVCSLIKALKNGIKNTQPNERGIHTDTELYGNDCLSQSAATS